MAKKDKTRIDTSGGSAFGSDVFASLSSEGLPEGPSGKSESDNAAARSSSSRGKRKLQRLEVRREKSGRAGKTVTAIYGFAGFSKSIRGDLLKDLKRKLATGGTLTGSGIEIQGDFADRVVGILNDLGYQAVRTGG